MKPICIYHGNCVDGFTAAWAVWSRFGDSYEYFAGVHGEEPPEVYGRDVLLVDFSYKRPVLERMAAEAKSITILDHHKSAEADLRPLLESGAVQGVFDMEKSGARLAWEWANPHFPVPALVRHVEDRDLWRFALEGTKDIMAAVFSYKHTFFNWQYLAQECERRPTTLRQIGAALQRKHMKDIREFIRAGQHRVVIAGYTVPAVNMPYFFASEAGHILAQGQPFAAVYWIEDKKYVVSLRSAPTGIDVSEIAAQFGGGGHKHAAGFKWPAGDPLPFETM